MAIALMKTLTMSLWSLTMTEFTLWQRLADGYSVEDVLEIIGLSPEELYEDYLAHLIRRHIDDFANI